MDILKKIWPFSFTAKKDIAALIISLVVHVVASIVIGFVIGILAKIPVVGVIVGLVGGLVGLYFLVGIVLLLLDYFKILK